MDLLRGMGFTVFGPFPSPSPSARPGIFSLFWVEFPGDSSLSLEDEPFGSSWPTFLPRWPGQGRAGPGRAEGQG